MTMADLRKFVSDNPNIPDDTAVLISTSIHNRRDHQAEASHIAHQTFPHRFPYNNGAAEDGLVIYPKPLSMV
jgi:hypothetical protein